MRLEALSPTNITEIKNVELSEFYGQFSTGGLVDFKSKRQGHFFNFYNELGEDSRVYCLRNEKDDKIEAIAAFIVRNGLYEGELSKIAFATDLRVSSHRRAIIEWGQYFLPVLKEIQEELKIQHVFSHINLTETPILNAFLRPRNIRRNLPRYHLYRKYHLNTLHGRFPWAPAPLKSVKFREGSSANEDALVHFIIQRGQFRPFSTIWSHESFQNKLQRMNNFSLANFIIAFDSKENIIGCLAPWSTNHLQHFTPQSYSLVAHNFRQFLKFGNLFGWTRPLTKPFSRTQENQPLNFRWLTHINVDNEDVFESLLWEAFVRINKNEFLIYPQVDQDFRTAPPLSWIFSKIPYALYSVLTPEAERPKFLDPSIVHNPEVDVGFV